MHSPLLVCFLLTTTISIFGSETEDAALPDFTKTGCDSYSLQTLPTLNLEQKTCIWRSQLVTGTAIFGASFFGAIAELRHKPPEWPQGLNGLGRQVGTRYTQGLVKSTGTFLAGAILREDPRALPPTDLTCSSRPTKFAPRLGQALLRVVWMRDSNCHQRPRVAPLVGSFASGFVSLAWAPPSVNKTSSALVGSGTAFGGYIGNSVFTEFQGDIFRMLGMLLPRGKK